MLSGEKARFDMRREVMANTKLSSGARLLFMWIDDMAAVHGDAYPSNRYLAEKLGFSEPSIKRFLRELRGAGYVRSWRRTNRSSVLTMGWQDPQVSRVILDLKGKAHGRSTQVSRVSFDLLIKNQGSLTKGVDLTQLTDEQLAALLDKAYERERKKQQ